MERVNTTNNCHFLMRLSEYLFDVEADNEIVDAMFKKYVASFLGRDVAKAQFTRRTS